ncbi:MAG TPA: hypothetical protein VGP25_09395 [Gemmatimonadaceae bacterium]|jgi:hypothetical protein|nr:hypothetical protein [Gemmatimonadaceae bacterium]
MTLSRTTVAIGALLLVGGCVTPLFPGSGQIFPPQDVMPARRGSAGTVGAKPDSASAIRSALSSKLVSGKEAPATLIARDGSRCSVSAKRYDDMREGEEAWCAWTNGK